MVTPGGSRPAGLSQRHVDALARGGHDAEALRMLRAARASQPPAGEERARAARPIDLSDEDMAAIRRSGDAPPAVAERIASSSRAPYEDAARAERPGDGGQGAPSAEPPAA
jgi:hypothetical protein